MNSTEEEVRKVIDIGLFVIRFLANTNRALKAIKLCKECLIVLKTKALRKEFFNFFCTLIYCQMCDGYSLINDHTSAIDCIQDLLVLLRASGGERDNEGKAILKLAELYERQYKYTEAKQLYMEALAIEKEISDQLLVASCYFRLGMVCKSVCEYGKASEYLYKALSIYKEFGAQKHEAACCGGLGRVFQCLGEYVKAKEYHQKALAIRKEIGDREGARMTYGNLGLVFKSLGEYGKAEENCKKAIAINKEIGDRKEEANNYVNLGNLFQSLGDHGKAEEYLQKALAISIEIGDKQGESQCYASLSNIFFSDGEHGKAEEYVQKALVLNKKTSDRKGEASCLVSLGNLFESLGEYGKAEAYLLKALTIKKKIGDRNGEAQCCGSLGNVFQSLGEYIKAEEYHQKALAICKEIGDRSGERRWHFQLSMDLVCEGNTQKALSNLYASIHKHEEMRGFVSDNDHFKISFFDESIDAYQLLSLMLCKIGRPYDALYIVELGRSRALADLMSSQYSVEQGISVNPQTWSGIEKSLKKETNCTCLYTSYIEKYVFLSTLKANELLLFRRIDVNDVFIPERSVRNVDEVFGSETFREFHVLTQEHCEDRTLFQPISSCPTRESQKDSMTAFLRPSEVKRQDPETNLSLYYKVIIAPVAGLLKDPEILIVPDRCLYKVPFAALKDGSGKYLSETFRIRIIPSLTTLKLIQDSPADYHCQTGALIVGDPDVGEVVYKGDVYNLPRLPFAGKEAQMIGELLGAEPLLGKQATKQAVLQRINSMSLIHFAAHGNAERGEIALAPPCSNSGIPQEEEYLLTMTDISQVRLRAKLVVLSCCHSARGQIRAEGVVGIARAFLGSGARSVLVALWALDDSATEHFMCRFYENLIRGKSASKSVHLSMKWMRENGFSDVRNWAPFTLIGDDVTFDFGKKRFGKRLRLYLRQCSKCF